MKRGILSLLAALVAFSVPSFGKEVKDGDTFCLGGKCVTANVTSTAQPGLYEVSYTDASGTSSKVYATGFQGAVNSAPPATAPGGREYQVIPKGSNGGRMHRTNAKGSPIDMGPKRKPKAPTGGSHQVLPDAGEFWISGLDNGTVGFEGGESLPPSILWSSDVLMPPIGFGANGVESGQDRKTGAKRSPRDVINVLPKDAGNPL
jgi:hypothetical protein